jgi:hypothetical protein
MTRLTTLALAAAAALAMSTAAQAAVTFAFTPGSDTPGVGYTPTPGYHVVDNFNQASSLAPITGSGYSLQGPGSTSAGANPAFPSGDNSTYLSVEAGGVANVNFTQAFTGSFQFDWGSIDDYNTLTIHTLTGDVVITPGGNFVNPANGDQFSGLTNGIFSIFGDDITGFSLTSSRNSFEIDDFAVRGGINPLTGGAIPEPAVWAMMILGFGGVGAMLRRKRALARVAIA